MPSLQRIICCTALLLLTPAQPLSAQTSDPAASYIFPAGAQRGQTVDVVVGGLFLLRDPWFDMPTDGIQAPQRLTTGDTLRLPGPLLTGQPSLEPDEYPQDHQGTLIVSADCKPGSYPWRVWTSQGGTASRVFVVGDLPELVEDEVAGDPIPVDVTLPVTINGRIHPRTDLDIWTFQAEQGESYAIELSARSLMSPLDARVAVFVGGERLTDSIGTQTSDPTIQFTARESGTHQIHVHDLGYAGGQAFVYRLTVRRGLRAPWIYPMGGQRGTAIACEVGQAPAADVDDRVMQTVNMPATAEHGEIISRTLTHQNLQTQPLRLEVGTLPERTEAEPNDTPTPLRTIDEPVVLNGRIQRPGDTDLWPLRLTADRPVELRLSAARLGSPLQPVMDLVDADGQVLAPSDSQPATTVPLTADLALSFTPGSDGQAWIRIRDRFTSRGGPGFAYRVQVGAPGPGFHLQFNQDAVTVFRGAEATLPFQLERIGGFTGPVSIEVDGLPPEITLSETLIAADQTQFGLKLTAADAAVIGGHRLTIHGVSTDTDEGQRIRRLATKPLAGTTQRIDSVLLSVAIATPFRFRNRGPYYAPVHAGTVYRHPFSVERNGFDGPITVRIADRQRRHLQGVHGLEECLIPAGTDDFDFPFFLPPNMSRDRLGRCLVMGIAEVTDEEGRQHQVAFTDGETAQAPINVKAPRLNVSCHETSVYAERGSTTDLVFHVKRDERLPLPVVVRLLVPDHMRGIQSESVTLAADETQGRLRLRVESTAGPFNCPLTVQATVIENGDPVVAEASVELVTD